MGDAAPATPPGDDEDEGKAPVAPAKPMSKAELEREEAVALQAMRNAFGDGDEDVDQDGLDEWGDADAEPQLEPEAVDAGACDDGEEDGELWGDGEDEEDQPHEASDE